MIGVDAAMAYKLTFEDGSDAFLSHHGVKGMKWGVWNEETRARRFGSSFGSNGAFDSVKSSGGGTGGIVDDSVWDIKNMAEIEAHPDIWKLLANPEDPDTAMSNINPYYKAGFLEMSVKNMFNLLDLKTTDDLDNTQIMKALFNCADCSVMYDLRRRGLDVDANMTLNFASKYKFIGDYYKGAKQVECKTLERCVSDLEKMPDGARGGLAGTTVNGGGHAVAWEKENGQIVFRDCQSNKKYTKDTIENVFVVNHESDGSPKLNDRNVSYVRLDDKTPDLKKFYDEGLVSKGGTSGRADRTEDRLRDVDGQETQTRKSYKNVYDRELETDSNYNKWLEYFEDKRDKARSLS
jgi:hypothetical protein